MSKSLGIQSIIKDSGYRIISNLLSGLSTETDPEVITNRIILTIENNDPYLFVSTMRSIVDTISKQNLSDIHRNQLIHCANKLIEKFVKYSQFHSFIGMIFNNTKTIPIIIPLLDIKNALAILVFSENTAFFGEAKAYISTTIIPKLTPSDYENLSEDILYELSNLFLGEFSMPEQITQTMPTSLSIFTDSFCPENKLSSSLSNPSLYDAVIECEPRSLISPANLERLLSFFQDFNASHAASYLTAISSSSCSFRQYFETLEDMQKGSVVKIIMKAFTDRGVDPSTIVNYLDQPNLKSLDKEGCAMLISFLSLISTNQKIDAYPFVIPWNNTRSQLDFLMYIATSQTNITFGNKCRMIPQEILTRINYDISTISNGCWICIDFVERFVELARIYPKDVVPFFQSCIHKFSHVILFAISQVNGQQSKEYIDFVNYIFNIVLYSQLGSRDYFEELWNYSSKFCMRAIFLFSKCSPQKLTKIAETFSPHLKELLDSDNLDFSIDLAFNVTIKDSINIEEFIDSIVAKNGQDILISFLQLVKTRALESHPTSMQVFIYTLNSIFKWLSNHFKTLNLETQLIANSLYSICENIGNGLQKFNFADSLPPVNPPDIKLASSEYFKQYFDGKTTLNKFLLILHHLKAVNTQLFEDMIHYPILELNYLSNNDIKFATKMGQLVGNMILENLYSESELSVIFSTFHKTYSEDSDQPLIIFTSSALTICYPKLTRIPIYVFNILKQPSFKQREPILYQNIKKISMSLSAPIQLSQTTKLNIHPKIRRFEKLQQPPPRLRKNLQNLNNDSKMLQPTIEAFQGYLDWLALHLVEDIEDHPVMLQTFIPAIIEDREFTEIMIQAASYEVYNLVEKSDEIATYEGGFKRRRLSILGRLIGNLTFALNRPILSKYIDIKRLLLYSLAHGKLFGVLPFVAAILRCATSFFEPPNPYMSAILQVLASINSIDLLKLSIKNQITLIMSHFKVTSSQFMIIPLIPNINEDNFDFITKPFSLLYFSNQADIDKIISFEDSAFYTLTSQHFIIPEYEGENAEEKRSKFRNALTNATLSFLKTEGKNLSQVASSTASELILKDFLLCNNMNLIYQTAETLTRQLSASLVMFTVFQKQQIYLHHNVLHDIDQKDSEWAMQGVQANHNFIGQLLKDVVYLKAWKIVQQKIENFEQQKKENNHNQRHQDLIPLSIQHLIPPSILPTEQGLLPQHNFIYQDLAELALNPAQIQIIDKTTESKSKSFETYESYFQWVSKRISSETNATDLNDQINSLLQLVSEKIPDVGPNFESFMSLIRTMMKYMYKNNHRINDTVFSRILEQIVSKAPPEYVTRMQPLIVSWLRNFIPSIQLLCEFLRTGLLTTKQLDKFFFDQLNRQPFNGRLYMFAVRFLHQTLIEKPTLKPSDMIDSLSFVVSTPNSLIESITTQTQQLPIDELQKVLDTIDVPLNVLSTNSKLQSVSIFDPLEELQDLEKIQVLLMEWKEIADDDSYDKTMECLEYGKNFFVYLFFAENEETISKFITLVHKFKLLDASFSHIMESLELVIQGNSHVISFDFRKYYDILIRLITFYANNTKLLNIASLLHNLRPLNAPAFTPDWAQLITHNHFVSYLIQNHSEVMKLLLEDYTFAVTYLQGAHAKDAFEVYYKSLLRFILILVHDFPDFMYDISLEVCSMFGSHFTQLRNIFLSVSPKGKLPPITEQFADDSFMKLKQVTPKLISELSFDEIQNEETMKKFVSQVEKRSGTTALHSFIVYLINKTECKDINKYLDLLVDNSSPETMINVLHVLFDQLRNPGRITNVFMKYIFSLMKKPKIDELIVTLAVERFSTPSPQPWGLRCFINYIITDKEINLSNKKFVSDSTEVQQFIEVIKKSVAQQ